MSTSALSPGSTLPRCHAATLRQEPANRACYFPSVSQQPVLAPASLSQCSRPEKLLSDSGLHFANFQVVLISLQSAARESFAPRFLLLARAPLPAMGSSLNEPRFRQLLMGAMFAGFPKTFPGKLYSSLTAAGDAQAARRRHLALPPFLRTLPSSCRHRHLCGVSSRACFVAPAAGSLDPFRPQVPCKALVLMGVHRPTLARAQVKWLSGQGLHR